LNGASAPRTGQSLSIVKSDYEEFERLLGDIQAAYSTENVPALRALVTPEMLSYFSEELAGNAGRGLINRVTSEASTRRLSKREGRTDYATAAMKFALKDSMVERASGRVVEGGERSEITELWTFSASD
jgi:predicted lipid-binding transport protein (Tim44 family)